MFKEPLMWVDKVWGEEIWLVNNEKYCGKFLILDRNAKSSYHMHKEKQETFMAIEGYALLTVEGKDHLLAPFTKPKTIMPSEKHMFAGITECVIMEVSTPHSEEDVFRFTESSPGKSDEVGCISNDKSELPTV